MTDFDPRHNAETSHESGTAEAPDLKSGALLNDEQIRWVRRAVVVMTAVLVGGIALLIGRVIYLAQRPNAQAASAAGLSTLPATLQPGVRLALPAGAEIKSVAANGSRLVVWYASPGAGDAIAVLDLVTGQVVSRVTVEKGR